jgi:hypothetical protein
VEITFDYDSSGNLMSVTPPSQSAHLSAAPRWTWTACAPAQSRRGDLEPAVAERAVGAQTTVGVVTLGARVDMGAFGIVGARAGWKGLDFLFGKMIPGASMAPGVQDVLTGGQP